MQFLDRVNNFRNEIVEWTAVLTLYLTNILRFNDNDAVVLYHTFISLCYFTPVLGAILADNYLGKFRWVTETKIIFASRMILSSYKL